MLEFRLFGPFEVLRDGELVTADQWKRRKTQSLCKVLISDRTRLFTTDQLVEILFPELEIDKANRNLRARISELRRVLEPDLDKGSASNFIVKHGEGYQFNPAAECEIDAERFTERLKIAVELRNTERWNLAIAQHEKSRETYRGDFLAEDIYEDWTAIARDQFEQQHLESLLHEADCHVRMGVYQRAIELCDLALSKRDHYENAFRKKMLYQYYSGNGSDALATYEQCKIQLATSLDSKPADETNELRDLIVRGKIPLPSKAIPNNLPGHRTTFVGRQKEIDQLEEMLTDRTNRLLTLLGPGGIGKSTLSIHVAQRALDREEFKDGIFFIPLAHLTQADHIVSAIAQKLNFSFYGNADPEDQLLAYLSSKQMLLILDNFEHLQMGASMASKMIEQTKHLRLLITTRERLQVAGECLLEISGLTYPDDQSAIQPNEIRACDSVKLFIQLAKRLRTDYNPADEELVEIGQICQLLNGIPLAIELSAPWIRLYSPKQIVDEISKSVDFLSSDLNDVTERHQSIRAVFEQSWSLISDEERQIFAALSVFQGGFSTDAAVDIAQTAPSMLISLMDKSFITSQQHGRLNIHELLRQFGAEKLASHPKRLKNARARHGQFFLSKLSASSDDMKNANQKNRIDEIQSDLENNRAAWDWGIENQEIEPIEWALDSLFYFFDIESRISEGTEMFENANSMTDKALAIRIAPRLGWFVFRLGQFERAEKLFKESLHLAEENRLEREIAFTSNYLGILKRVKGEKKFAEALHTRDLQISTELQDTFGIARASNNLGIVKQEQGLYDDAKILYQEGLTLFETLGNQLGISKAYNNLGVIERLQGNALGAQELYEKTIDIDRAIGDQFGISITLLNLGNTARDLGDSEKAKMHYEEALEIAETIGEKFSIAILLSLLSVIAFEQEQITYACDLAVQSLQTSQEIDALPITLETLVNSANLLNEYLEPLEMIQLLSAIQDHPSVSEAVRTEATNLLRQNHTPPDLQPTPLSDDKLIELVRSIEDRLNRKS